MGAEKGKGKPENKRKNQTEECTPKINHISMSSRPPLGFTQYTIQSMPGALPPGTERPVREADHTPQTSAEVELTWNYT
jgi:hypothetical protein